MKKLHSGYIDIHGVALEPIHHGGGKAGNTQLVRMLPGFDPVTGKLTRTPFISGNALRHMLRAAGAWYAIEALGIKGDLSKGAIDLIFSGGRLSSGGAVYKLDEARAAEAAFPVLAVLGYGAGNMTRESKLSVSHLHLVCAENAWKVEHRINPSLPHAQMRAGGFLTDGFGTRHDQIGAAGTMDLLEDGEEERLAEAISKGASKAEKESTQMIFEVQSVGPGSHWRGQWDYSRLTDLEYAALRTCIENAALCVGPTAESVFGEAGGGLPRGIVYRIGGMSARGYGRMAFWMHNHLRHTIDADAPQFEDAGALALRGEPGEWTEPEASDPLREYVDHLRANREEIVDILKRISK